MPEFILAEQGSSLNSISCRFNSVSHGIAVKIDTGSKQKSVLLERLGTIVRGGA